MAKASARICALDGLRSWPDSSEVQRLKPEDALTNQDVIDMLSTDGLPACVVIEKIKKSQNCIFDTSREALKQLRAAGVSDSVVVVMIKAS